MVHSHHPFAAFYLSQILSRLSCIRQAFTSLLVHVEQDSWLFNRHFVVTCTVCTWGEWITEEDCAVWITPWTWTCSPGSCTTVRGAGPRRDICNRSEIVNKAQLLQQSEDVNTWRKARGEHASAEASFKLSPRSYPAKMCIFQVYICIQKGWNCYLFASGEGENQIRMMGKWFKCCNFNTGCPKWRPTEQNSSQPQCWGEQSIHT